MLSRTRLFFSRLNYRLMQNFKYSIKIGDKPLGSIFFHPEVYFCMKKLIEVDYDKLFDVRKMGVPLKVPHYTFMTDQELKNELDRIKQKAGELLQMPPLIDVTEDKIEVLANDVCLDGHDEHHAKLVFTDISFDIENHERIILVREPSGLLRTASKNERYRMNQIYFPTPGRKYYPLRMFESPHMEEVLGRGEYEYLLNVACVQFDLEDEDYHKAISKVFDCVNMKGDFDKLIKTRHFGPFCLYLAVKDNINQILAFFLNKHDLIKASLVIRIHRVVHTETPWSYNEAVFMTESQKKNILTFDEARKTIEDYVSNPSNNASALKPNFEAAVENHYKQDQSETKVAKAESVS